jgi:glycine betaine/choline ABC-type transport system substrate-binding protein
VRAVIERLSGRITAADMRAMNYAADAEHRDPRDIAHQFLDTLP